MKKLPFSILNKSIPSIQSIIDSDGEFYSDPHQLESDSIVVQVNGGVGAPNGAVQLLFETSVDGIKFSSLKDSADEAVELNYVDDTESILITPLKTGLWLRVKVVLTEATTGVLTVIARD